MAEKPTIRPLAPSEGVRMGISMRTERYIGRICSSWSSLEAVMQDVLWRVLGVPIDDGRILTANADTNRRIKWLSVFAEKHLKGDELASMKLAIAKIEEHRQDRNFVVHGSWAELDPSGIPICMSVREKNPNPTEIVAEPFPEERMRALWQGIADGKAALMRWANSHAQARGVPLPYPPIPDPKKA